MVPTDADFEKNDVKKKIKAYSGRMAARHEAEKKDMMEKKE